MSLFNCVYPKFQHINCPHNLFGNLEFCQIPNPGLRGENDVEHPMTCRERYRVENEQNYVAYTGRKQTIALVGMIVSTVLATIGAVSAGFIVLILPLGLPFLIGAVVVGVIGLAGLGVFMPGWNAATRENDAASLPPSGWR